jgi:hypothetical protein
MGITVFFAGGDVGDAWLFIFDWQRSEQVVAAAGSWREGCPQCVDDLYVGEDQLQVR